MLSYMAVVVSFLHSDIGMVLKSSLGAYNWWRSHLEFRCKGVKVQIVFVLACTVVDDV